MSQFTGCLHPTRNHIPFEPDLDPVERVAHAPRVEGSPGRLAEPELRREAGVKPALPPQL